MKTGLEVIFKKSKIYTNSEKVKNINVFKIWPKYAQSKRNDY
jgi:hypothetical protein